MTTDADDFMQLRDRLLRALLAAVEQNEAQPLAALHALLDTKVREAERLQGEDFADHFAGVHAQINLVAASLRVAAMARAAMTLTVASGINAADLAGYQAAQRSV
jgi:predicted ATPase